MRAFALAFALALTANAAIADQPAQPQVYALELWMPVGQGFGQAVSLGPMSPEKCHQVLPAVRRAAREEFPPNLQSRVSMCATTWQLQAQLSMWKCTASQQKAIGNTTLWHYGCAVF